MTTYFSQRYPSCSFEDRLITFSHQLINIDFILNYLDFEKAGAQRSPIFKSA